MSSEELSPKLFGRRIYKRPPLTEVVLELRIDPLPSNSVDALRSFRQGADVNRYPHEERLFESGVEVEFQPTGDKPKILSQSSDPVGFLFQSANNTELVQVRRNGLSYHKLPPYSRWEDCVAETRRLWSRFLSVAPAYQVNRLGLRYVNRLVLPAPVELKDYVRTFPEISPELPQLLSGYVMQVSIPQPDPVKTVLIMRQALGPSPAPNAALVVLDNDLVSVGHFAAEGQAIWDTFEHLHERQNEVFEGTITDATREILDNASRRD
jgi:uncharacterized protein (TIGR04255 family)